MTWIKTVPIPEADGRLREVYQQLFALFPGEYLEQVPAVVKPDGTADRIMAAHSLLPEVMNHIFTAYGLLLSADLPLSRQQHEMIATVVSSLNRCFY